MLQNNFQFFLVDRFLPVKLVHFQDNLMTIIDRCKITFTKINIEKKSELLKQYNHIVRMNSTYRKVF